jgi:hypothetical protein
LFPARGQCGFPSPGRKEESLSLGRRLERGVHLSLLPLNQMHCHYLNIGGHSNLGTRPRAHCSLSRRWKTRWVRVLIGQLGWKQGRGGETSEQLIKEVVSKLTNDLVENVRMPDVRCDGAFTGEVSSGSALEAGECVCPGLVNVHWNDCWKHGRWKWGEQYRSAHGSWSWEYARSAWPR